MADLSVSWNDNGFQAIHALVDEGTAKAAGRVRDRAKLNIRSAGLIDTGAMMQSVVSEKVTDSAGVITYRVSARVPYAVYQHEGTGPIVPRTAKVLRFTPKGGKTPIFRPRSKGVTGVPFLTAALVDLTTKDFRA